MATAQGLFSDRCVLLAPPGATITIENPDGSTEDITVDGSFLAAAFAGLDANPAYDVAEPLTRKNIVGFKSVDTRYTMLDGNDLASAGVTVIETVGTALRVRHAITTMPSNALTREITVVKIKDYTAQSCRAGANQFIGTKLTPSRPNDVQRAIQNVLTLLKQASIIDGFKDLEASQDTVEPTQIDVSFKIQPTFPLNYLLISFSVTSASS
jgi:hypothetical protein